MFMSAGTNCISCHLKQEAIINYLTLTQVSKTKLFWLRVYYTIVVISEYTTAYDIYITSLYVLDHKLSLTAK